MHVGMPTDKLLYLLMVYKVNSDPIPLETNTFLFTYILDYLLKSPESQIYGCR